RRDQLRAAGKKFRRPTFVRLTVRALVANDAVIRTAQMRERERVRGGAVEDEKDLAVLLKNLADTRDDAPSPSVVAVGNLGVSIRFRESSPRRRTNARGVIARKVVTFRRRSHRRCQ